MYNLGIGKGRPIRQNNAWHQHVWASISERITVANLIGLMGIILALLCLLALPTAQYANLRLPLYLIVIGWTMLRPRVALYLLPLAVPWGSLDTGEGITLKGYDADVLVGLLAASWLLSFTLRPFATIGNRSIGTLDRERFNVPRYLALTIILLLLAMLISMTAATSFSSSLKEIVKWLECLVILLLGTQYLRTRRQIWTVVIIFCLAAISQALLGYAQAFLNLGPTSFIRDSTLRVYGTFGQPNPLAGYINMSLTIVIALLLLARKNSLQLGAAIAAIILAGAEYYTQSKGGWLAMIVAVLFILAVGFPRLRVWIGMGSALVVAGTIAIFAGLLPERRLDPILVKVGLVNISFTQPTHASYANSERVAHWIAGIHMFLDHPFLGVGIGNYGIVYYPRYTVGIFIIPLGHAHNYYINMAAEAGIFALVALLAFLTATFLAGGRSFHKISRSYQETKAQFSQLRRGLATANTKNTFRHLSILVNDRALAVGLLAALLSISVHNLVDNLYVHGMTSLFALLLVLVIRLGGVTQEM